jgi:hypothetical protein
MNIVLIILIAVIIYLYCKNKKKIVTPVVQRTTINNVSNVKQRNSTPTGR